MSSVNAAEELCDGLVGSFTNNIVNSLIDTGLCAEETGPALVEIFKLINYLANLERVTPDSPIPVIPSSV